MTTTLEHLSASGPGHRSIESDGCRNLRSGRSRVVNVRRRGASPATGRVTADGCG